LQTFLRKLPTLAVIVVSAAVVVRFASASEARRRRIFPFVRPVYRRVFNPRVPSAAAKGKAKWAGIDLTTPGETLTKSFNICSIEADNLKRKQAW
jgi:hypothetical protein